MDKHKEYVKSLSANNLYVYPNGDIYEGDYRNDRVGGPNIREGLGVFHYIIVVVWGMVWRMRDEGTTK